MTNQPEANPPSRQLTLLNEASMALAQAKTLYEIKDVRDKAEAVRHYAKSIALGLEMQNHAAEIKLRAERKAGELLADLPLCGGNRKSNSHDENVKLGDFGIDHNQSARWQREAAVPEHEFERYLNQTNAAKKEVSAAGLLQVARKLGIAARPYFNRNAGHTAGQNAGGGRQRSRPGGDSTAKENGRDGSVPSNRGRNTERPAVNDKGLGSDIVQEVKDHLELLSKILTPICSTRGAELRKAERDHVRRLLLEIERLLDDLLDLISGKT